MTLESLANVSGIEVQISGIYIFRQHWLTMNMNAYSYFILNMQWGYLIKMHLFGVFTLGHFQPFKLTQTDDSAFFAHMWTQQPYPDPFEMIRSETTSGGGLSTVRLIYALWTQSPPGSLRLFHCIVLGLRAHLSWTGPEREPGLLCKRLTMWTKKELSSFSLGPLFGPLTEYWVWFAYRGLYVKTPLMCVFNILLPIIWQKMLWKKNTAKSQID